MRLLERNLDLFGWKDGAEHRLIDFRILLHFSTMLPRFWQAASSKALAALRYCAGTAASRFPLVRESALEMLAVSLNNYAVDFNSLEAAEEALALPQEDRWGCLSLYVSAFSAWQIARLSTATSRADRLALGRRAHSMAERALEAALNENNKTYANLAEDILRHIEMDFPKSCSKRMIEYLRV